VRVGSPAAIFRKSSVFRYQESRGSQDAAEGYRELLHAQQKAKTAA
jgi:hypothetical protein